MINFKKTLIGLSRIENREKRSKYKLNLNRNENIRGFNFYQKKNLINFIFNTKINYYPNLKDTYLKLSKFLKISQKKILICEGVSGAIKNILDSLEIKKNSEIIIPEPSFALYKIYGKLYGLKVKKFKYDKNFELNPSNILKLINSNTLAVFLPVPNIPVEGNISKLEIVKLAKNLKKKNILFAIDEVYYPFGNTTFKSLINYFNNVVVMRSFSKAYGLAGLRIGYLMSCEKNIKILNNTKGGYETNILSARAIDFVIKNNSISQKYIRDTKAGINILKKNLDKLKLEYYGGQNGNFIFVNFKNKMIAQKIYKSLKKNKIAIRHGFPKPFDKGVLITCCPKKEMQKFINIFNKII